MKKRLLFGILLLLTPLIGLWAENTDDNTYRTTERLFHIARSANKNLVCYDVNLENGLLNTKEPLKVYWVNREDHPGETDGLNYIQKKLAYGYKLVSSQNNSCICSLTAYPQRKLTITRLDSSYVCLITIDNKPAILQSLYVKAHPRNPLNVEYVELHGVTLHSNEPVSERINR